MATPVDRRERLRVRRFGQLVKGIEHLRKTDHS
jgi:hypothetical protein